MMDLFEFSAKYPARPGFQERGTSKDAAKAASGGAAGLRERVLGAIRASGPAGLTADQAAFSVGLTPFSGRPRVTELAKAGKITKTGERRLNASGLKAAVWRVP